MTAASVIERMEVLTTGIEVVRLEVSDGETYVAKKLSIIVGATVSGNEDVDAQINATWSADKVTINYAGASDKDVTLVLYGQP